MTTEIITLIQLCKELKPDPRVARERLFAAARDTKKYPQLAKSYKPRPLWRWVKGSSPKRETRIALGI